MAYTKNLEWINAQIRAKGIVAYKIQDERKNTLAENEEISPDIVIAELEGILPNLSGMVLLNLSPKSKTEKQAGGTATRQDLNITLQLGGPNAPAPIVAGIGAVDNTRLFAEMEQRFNDKLEAQKIEFKHATEMADLRRKLAEAEEGNPTMKMLEPHLPGIIAGIFGGGGTPGIAGVPHTTDIPHITEEIEFTEVDDQRAEAAIKRLLAVDQNFIEVLERLAILAETNLPFYNQAKSMLPPL